MDPATILVALFFIAVFVGIGVSMDVSGYNLSMAGNKEYSDKPLTHSFFHALWHGMFLAIGIGLFTGLNFALSWTVFSFDLGWMFEFIANLIPWEVDPVQVPLIIFAIIGMGFWAKLYYDKIRGDEEEDIVPPWLNWALKLLRVPAGQTQYVLVAVDMWFLAPLLKTIIQEYSVPGQILFVAIVFATVFTCSMISMHYGRKLLKTRHPKSLAYWLVTLMWLEPMTTGYFAVRAGWWTFTGVLDNNPLFFVLAGGFIVFLFIGRFEGHVDDAYETAHNAMKAEPTTA